MLRRRDRAAVSAANVLPGYTDLAEIGGGAFATVFRATESETGREVALKILKLDTVHPNLIQTFNNEIRALAKVSDHPNIVTLYRPLTTPDGRPVLVLELCRESLAQRVRRSGPLDARETVRVGIKIAGALEAAHSSGFLHRDMKPQNILVTQFDEPALADFGVVALQTSAQAAAAGVFGFTSLHAAPEVLEGRHLSAATDVYGLASTMYELLTGQAPFTAFDNEAPAAVILRILRDPVRPVRSDSVPLDLSDLLEAALAKEPGRRPQRAALFAEALSGIEASCRWPQTSHPAFGETSAFGEPGLGESAGVTPTGVTPTGPPMGGRPRRPLLTPLLPPLLPSVASDPLAPPAPSPGPSVHAPDLAARNVVVPGGTVRGQPSLPVDQDSGQLPPLIVPGSAARHEAGDGGATRPLFIDPDDRAATSSPAAGTSSPAAGGPRPGSAGSISRHVPVAASSSVRPRDRSLRDIRPVAIAGVALAALVVIAAILLIVGAL